MGKPFNPSTANDLTASKSTVTSLSEATLAGSMNDVAVMAGDTQVAYAEAQLMVGGFTTTTSGVITPKATRIGKTAYIYVVLVVNIVVIVLLHTEHVRTRSRRRLVSFDYVDQVSFVL